MTYSTYLARRTMAAVLSIVLASTAVAQPQVSHHTLRFGVPGTVGCQGTTPVLNNGVPASGAIDFTYDLASHVLTLDVVNDSPVSAGVPNPVITRIAFSLPRDAITGATLLQQTSAGGGNPGFVLKVDPAPQPQLQMSCLGGFGVRLTADANGGAIGNAAATTFAVSSVAIGPATLQIQLSGPGVDFATARTIAVGFSQQASLRGVNAALQFDGGGTAGLGSGIIAGSDDDALAGGTQPAVWLGRPANASNPGQPDPVPLCASAVPTTHACLLLSSQPDPTVFGPFTIPIGTIEIVVPLGAMPASGNLCLPLILDPATAGMTVYLTMVTARPTAPGLDFSPRFDLQVLAPL